MILEDFERFVRDTSPALLSYLARCTDPPHDAADVLAETLFTAYRKIDAVPSDPHEAKFWLFAVARKQLANYRRGKVRHRNLSTRLAESIRVSSPEPADTGAQDLLDQLSTRDRELVTLVVLEGFGVTEAGHILGISSSTARSRYSRAKAKMRAVNQHQSRSSPTAQPASSGA